MKVRKKKRLERIERAKANRKPFVCPNCGKLTQTGHYAPPMFGSSGGWWCETFTDLRDGGI